MHDPRVKERTVGEYALHVSCNWRITAADLSVVLLLGDDRVGRWVRDGPYTVEAVEAKANGALQIKLSNAFTLQVLADGPVGTEQWRFFQPYRDLPHFIVER